MKNATAALLVIGDEILTGKVKDENSFVFTKVMFEQGVYVDRIEVIRDDIETIADRVAYYSLQHSYVCTSGGVGPTHDDRTFEGVAKAFSLPLEESPTALAYFQKAQEQAGRGSVVSQAQKKMLIFPKSSELFFIESLWLPLVQVKNVYVFPGVPYLFNKMMEQKKSLFKGAQFFREIIYTDLSENTIAQALGQMQEEYKDVNIGSYPQMPDSSFNVMVSIEGMLKDRVSLVKSRLLPLINGRSQR